MMRSPNATKHCSGSEPYSWSIIAVSPKNSSARVQRYQASCAWVMTTSYRSATASIHSRSSLEGGSSPYRSHIADSEGSMRKSSRLYHARKMNRCDTAVCAVLTMSRNGPAPCAVEMDMRKRRG